MTHIPTSSVADQAHTHLGERGPTDTCVSNGPEEWARELGLPTLGTASVTEYVRLAKLGKNGYQYHDGTNGIARGHIGVWTHDALGSDQKEHVCVVDQVQGNLWRGIGSGTPSGTVARQPASGGFNPLSVLRGYVILPTDTGGQEKPAAVKPKPAHAAPSKGDEYVVKRGDTLVKIAARTKVKGGWKAIVAANPRSTDGKSRDFHILRPNYITVGQRIRIP